MVKWYNCTVHICEKCGELKYDIGYEGNKISFCLPCRNNTNHKYIKTIKQHCSPYQNIPGRRYV